MIVFSFVCVSVIVWNAPVSLLLLCVRLCTQTCWLVADNNTRGRVFVGLLTEEIPTMLSVSGLCVFEVARVTPPAVLFSYWPPQPYPALVPYRPLLPSEACSSSDKGCAGQTVSRAPQSCSTPTICTPFPSTLTPFTWENTGSYLQLTGAMAPTQSESDCSYMRAKLRNLHDWIWEGG